MLARFSSFWIYPLAAILLLHLSVRLEPERSPVELLWLFPAGLLGWTLLEYFLHRFLFHWDSSSRRMRELLKQLHLAHHADPRNPGRILVRPIYSLPLSAFFFLALLGVLGSLFSASSLMAGLWAGFLYYEWVHYRVHRSASTRGLLASQRRRHFYHHFVDGDKCFGVTSPLWDVMFGTWPPTKSEPRA